MNALDFLPQSYGYVITISLLSFFLNFYFMANVGKARLKYKVQYPDMYSKDNKIFNCIQRVHQNYLETIPFFLLVLFLGGLQNPKLAAIFGAGFLVSRLTYSFGYSTGIPDKRKFGAIGGYISMLGLVVLSIMFAYRSL